MHTTNICEKVDSLETKVAVLAKMLDNLSNDHERMPQYSRRSCLRVTGNNETVGESVDNVI